MKAAHSSSITRLERYKFTDVIVSSSSDGTLNFFDLNTKAKSCETVHKHSQPVQFFQFADNYNYIVSCCLQRVNIFRIVNNSLTSSKITESQLNKSQMNNPVYLTVNLEQTLNIEDYGPQYTSMRIFSTNFTADFILFLTAGSNLHLLNILNGDCIGEIEGANFRGTCNFGVISDESNTST